MSREEKGSEDTEDTKAASHKEHPSVAEVGLEDGDLGHGDDGCAVGDGLGEQQPEVSFVVDRAKGIIDSGRHNSVDTREGAVQDGHQDAIPRLGPYRFLT